MNLYLKEIRVFSSDESDCLLIDSFRFFLFVFCQISLLFWIFLFVLSYSLCDRQCRWNFCVQLCALPFVDDYRCEQVFIFFKENPENRYSFQQKQKKKSLKRFKFFQWCLYKHFLPNWAKWIVMKRKSTIHHDERWTFSTEFSLNKNRTNFWRYLVEWTCSRHLFIVLMSNKSHTEDSPVDFSIRNGPYTNKDHFYWNDEFDSHLER